jgi:hypothetical protein
MRRYSTPSATAPAAIDVANLGPHLSGLAFPRKPKAQSNAAKFAAADELPPVAPRFFEKIPNIMIHID